MAISSPFSEVSWVRRDLPSITNEDFSDSEIEQAIKDGDKCVVDDLSKYIDFTEITSVPEAVKRLSHYKACELVLLRVINNPAIVSDENSLVNYWSRLYRELLEDIRKGKIKLLDSDKEEYEPDEVTRSSTLGRII